MTSIMDFNGLIVQNKKVGFDEIQTITAYKVDLITTDEIRFDIELVESTLTITEEDAEFPQIDRLLAEKLDGYNGQWRGLIVHPPFSEQRTTVYSKCT